MLDEVVSFALEAPMGSTSEVPDECASLSVLLRQENANGMQLYYITVETLTPSQTKFPGKKKATIYPIEQGKSKAGFSETDSLSWKLKKKI